MSFSAATALVTMVFAAQILVLSIWVPFRLQGAYPTLRQKYPPAVDPRLYPVALLTDERFNAKLLVVRLVIVVAGIALFAAELPAGQGPHALARTMVWILLALLLALRGARSIPRPDPYMTDADVFRTRRQRLRLLFSGATVLGSMFTVLLLFEAGKLQVDLVAICLGTSILCQLVYLGTARIAMRTLTRRDASVYRAEAT